MLYLLRLPLPWRTLAVYATLSAAILSGYAPAVAPIARADEPLPLVRQGKPDFGWKFDNGSEFPGAKGELEVDAAVKQNGLESLRLSGDFSGGGNYVQAIYDFPAGTDIQDLSFWIRNLRKDHITIRLVDSAGRCHQFNLKTTPEEGWQRIVFPLERYFASQSTSAALKIVSKYEAWGGDEKSQGTWNGPAKSLSILIGKGPDQNPLNTVWLNSISVVPRALAREATKLETTVVLDEVVDGEHLWEFHDGREFPGAKGSLTVAPGTEGESGNVLQLGGDFTGGGIYVAGIRKLEEFALQDVKEFRLRYRTTDAKSIGVRIGDATGQTHQKKKIPLTADGQWHDLVLRPQEIAGGEHWGGANDGRWHGAPQYISIGLGKPEGDPKTASLQLAQVRATGVVAAGSGDTAWQAPFEGAPAQAIAGWQTQGAVQVDAAEGFKGKQSLRLSKTEQTLRDSVTAAGPAFPARPGAWEVTFAGKSDLTSMDNSYNGSLRIEFLDATGKSLGARELETYFRKMGWRPVKKQVEAPAGTASARFVASINKETPGRFWIDELGIAPVVLERKDDSIRRLMFTTAQMGNLLFPDDSREITLEVWASKPLKADMRKVVLTVHDYWGAEQAEPLTATLARDGRKDALFRYTAKVDLKGIALETGRYYEIHGAIQRADAEPFTNYTSFAILPEAPNNAHKAEEVPFTSRNWDNRIAEYVRLSKRLGIRICGIWGRMDADPAKVSAPQLDLIGELGMGYLTGSAAHDVEQRSKGWEELLANDGAKLREGVRNYMAKFGGKVRPAYVNLGNEPHQKGDEVKANVEAYRIVYTELKKIDPTMYVVGTSVFSEDFFKHGYGQWLDAYDFHVYEDAKSVRRIVSEGFPAMFRKYGHPKPVWSTELGLNSQGMARQFVAAEVYRKFVNFFAGGGANVSWFGIIYPDPEGKSHDSFGSAHNTFDCRYNKYAPKLDAIAVYNAANAIGIKKYVQDKEYGADIHAFLFQDRDGRSLQVWYKDKGREDIFIPMPGIGEVQLVRIDGTRSTLYAGDTGITLTITEDPIVVLYQGGEKELPQQLGTPAASLAAAPPLLVRGTESELAVALQGVDAQKVSLKSPPMWKAVKGVARTSASGDVLPFRLSAPEHSAVREAEMVVTLAGADGKPRGELYYRPQVTGTLSAQVLPVPVQDATQRPVIKIVVTNNSDKRQKVNWDLVLTGEQSLREGVFSKVEPTSAYFTEAASGSLEVEGMKSAEVQLPVAEGDLYTVYRARATIRDAGGRTTVVERPVSAFYPVRKAKQALQVDGVTDEADWKHAQVRKLDNINQFYAFRTKDKPAAADWTGAEDLSAEIRYLWDDAYFYVSVKVKDDVAGKILHKDGSLWQQDGLQFLIDPMRTSAYKVGKYEYQLGLGTAGAQTWCTLSADGAAPAGSAPEIRLAMQKDKEGTGDVTYEVAIPWSRLAPFKPFVSNNLGFTLIINEDDGAGRNAFMTWFGNAHSKDIDTVGDLILTE
ncbi:hypothetical protein DB346_01110 [Verrucomicrobia bacterium LW23]|nr:hypothetical protein DB346_01110 [Verrucomicrobia bacterium LW23]